MPSEGNWTGFRILDISEPDDPVLLNFVECDGNQGDVVVSGQLSRAHGKSFQVPVAVYSTGRR